MSKRSRAMRRRSPGAGHSEKREGTVTAPGKPVEPSGIRQSQETPQSAMSIGAFVTALLLTFLITRIPREVATNSLDSSWGAVLSYAHEKRLQFGTDIVFTYGPLGFLDQQWFTGRGEGLRIFFEFLRGFGIALGACLLAWRMNLVWRCVFLGVFVLLPATIHPEKIEPLMETGLFCWGVLNLLEAGRRNRFFALGLVLMATLGSLGKFTFCLMAAMTVAVVACELVNRGRQKLGLGLVAGYGLSFLIGWVLLRQDLFRLGVYLANALSVSIGYEETMGWKTAQDIWTAGVLMVALALAVALIYSVAADGKGSRRPGLRRVMLFAWMAGFVFLLWKHGFIRHKMDLFATAVPVLVLALDALPCAYKTARLWARACALSCCLVAVVFVGMLTPGYFGEIVSRDVSLISSNLGTLLKPSAYLERMTNALDTERDVAQLPRIRGLIGQATVDVFGQYQSFALFNDLNYHPRPVFQSYSAYNENLMKLNDDRYNADAAPEFVLFNLEPIDGRFPALEDAYTLRNLLINYEPIECEGRFLLLKHRQSLVPEMSLLKEGSARPGEPINFSEFGDADIWMEISVQPTWRGRLRQLFFKPSEIYLGVWRGQPGSQPMGFRAPVPMLAAGFLASPLVFHNQEMVDCYTGQDLQRPGAFSVNVESRELNFWQDEIKYKIYRIDTKLGRCSPPDTARLKLPGFQFVPQQIVAPSNSVNLVTVGGNPALLLRPGGQMIFNIPPGATNVSASFGFAEPSYLQGATAGGEFRVEEVAKDGTTRLLFSQTLSPRTRAEDRGLKHFSVPLPAQDGGTVVVFRSVSASQDNFQWDLTCWAEIRFGTNEPVANSPRQP
jgi:hypothetical protein